jgi:hypothetical protein
MFTKPMTVLQKLVLFSVRRIDHLLSRFDLKAWMADGEQQV